MRICRSVWWVLGMACLGVMAGGCENRAVQRSALDVATPAPTSPWQPPGLRVPTLRCEFAVPAGWSQHPSPMPDHIAELSAGGGKSIVLIEQRVEPNPTTAMEHIRAYYRSGLLTAADAQIVSDAQLDGTAVPAHRLSIRWGAAAARRIETVIVLAFTKQPLVTIVARHDDSDGPAAEAVLTLVRSLRCA